MNKKYLVDVTDLSPNTLHERSALSFSDPKSLFDKDKVNFKDISNSPFTPPPQKQSFPWGLLLLAAITVPIFFPDLRDRINFDYSPSTYTPKLKTNDDIVKPDQSQLLLEVKK